MGGGSVSHSQKSGMQPAGTLAVVVGARRLERKKQHDLLSLESV